MDNISPEQRSWVMSRIKSTNTKPELVIRSTLHRMGFRFRLNGKVSKKIMENGFLPGHPDIVLKKYKTVVFVNGCFWHMHDNCKIFRLPKTRIDWWRDKLQRNKSRDGRNRILLEEMGWRVVVVWECEIRENRDDLEGFMRERMGGQRGAMRLFERSRH